MAKGVPTTMPNASVQASVVWAVSPLARSQRVTSWKSANRIAPTSGKTRYSDRSLKPGRATRMTAAKPTMTAIQLTRGTRSLRTEADSRTTRNGAAKRMTVDLGERQVADRQHHGDAGADGDEGAAKLGKRPRCPEQRAPVRRRGGGEQHRQRHGVARPDDLPDRLGFGEQLAEGVDTGEERGGHDNQNDAPHHVMGGGLRRGHSLLSAFSRRTMAEAGLRRVKSEWEVPAATHRRGIAETIQEIVATMPSLRPRRSRPAPAKPPPS